MKNVMKDEDLEKVSGGWIISGGYSDGGVLIQFLTEPQMEALRNLSKELGLDWEFLSDSCVLESFDEAWDPHCGRCDISEGSFNKEIFERIKQVIGEPDQVIGL